MDNQDLEGAVNALVVVLKKLTRVVKTLPFIYLIIYVVYLGLDICSAEYIINNIDCLFTVSPSITAVFLLLSKTLKLCRWHKTACVIPLSTQFESYTDSFIFQFTQNEIIVVNTVIGLSVMVFLYLAYRHFCNGRKRAY